MTNHPWINQRHFQFNPTPPKNHMWQIGDYFIRDYEHNIVYQYNGIQFIKCSWIGGRILNEQ